jgi:hypothetical protein
MNVFAGHSKGIANGSILTFFKNFAFVKKATLQVAKGNVGILKDMLNGFEQRHAIIAGWQIASVWEICPHHDISNANYGEEQRIVRVLNVVIGISRKVERYKQKNARC